METVTQGDLAYRCAEIAAAISIQPMTTPPKIVPSAFVCDGKTISVMRTGLRSGPLFFSGFAIGVCRLPCRGAVVGMFAVHLFIDMDKTIHVFQMFCISL